MAEKAEKAERAESVEHPDETGAQAQTTLAPGRPLRIAALVKQIPKIEAMTLGPDGRLVRDGIEMHMNDYCRRAVAKGHEIARASGGTLTVVTLGPPIAENVLREAIAFGADHGVHITDPAFAGSDTWATARALAAAIEKIGPFDLILMGRNSIDADTGQVPPELAAMLRLPFCTGVRELSLVGEVLTLGLEHDDEWVRAEVTLPAIISCAERLTDPCKIKDPTIWASVDGSKIERLVADDLGPGPWGQEASPTSVGVVKTLPVTRERVIATGSLPEQVATAIEVLLRRDALDFTIAAQTASVADPAGREEAGAGVGGAGGGREGTAAGPAIAVLVEAARARVTRELLGGAAELAAEIGGHVVAIGPAAATSDERTLAASGADVIVALRGSDVEEDLASALTSWCQANAPWAVLAPSTPWGREVLSRAAGVLSAGVTGDAVGLSVRDGRMIALKPAFGGSLVAEILCGSAIQMATVRAGVLPLLSPRGPRLIARNEIAVASNSRVRVLSREREDDAEEMASAPFVIGVGQGVKPADYPDLDTMRTKLGAVYCATRKVTDKGWMPRARQVGITGHSIAPRLYIALGLSGKFNHTVGVRSAGTVVAVNPDAEAEVFKHADIGIVGDWREVMPLLTTAILAARGQ